MAVTAIDMSGISSITLYRIAANQEGTRQKLIDIGQAKAVQCDAALSRAMHSRQKEPCVAGHLWVTRSKTPAYSIYTTTEAASRSNAAHNILHW